MKALLKKLGIVVAASAAAALAMSPLAFAGDDDGHGDHDKDKKSSHHHRGHDGVRGDCNIAQRTGDATQTNSLLGLVVLNDVLSDANVAVPICDNNVNVQVVPIGSPNDQENE